MKQGFIKTSAMKLNVCDNFQVSKQSSKKKRNGKNSLTGLIENPTMLLMKARKQEELKMWVWQEGKRIKLMPGEIRRKQVQ